VWRRSVAGSKRILTSFDERITNGFVEGMHTKITLIKRRAFGFRGRADPCGQVARD
jgi:transposase